MGEEIKIIDVQAENGGTIIQVDIEYSKGKERLFISTKDILKALNNYIYTAYDQKMLDMGMELVDPENYKNPNLLN